MNRLSRYQRTHIVQLLVEGNSINGTCRIAGVSKNTVLKLLADLGQVCAAHQDDTIRNVTAKRIQCDEIWSFVHAKAKNVPEHRKGEFGIGDMWTWVALDADTKLCVSWAVGGRDAGTANLFLDSVAQRLSHRVQLTTDGYHVYLDAVAGAFGFDVDFAQLIKKYGDAPNPEKRYSPGIFTGTETRVITGIPDTKHISTSYVERQNLTMRMSMRRFTRLTNGFSKKAENLAYAVALHFEYYNFCRPHQTLKGRTPAMAAGLTDRVWTIDDLIELLEAAEAADLHTKPN